MRVLKICLIVLVLTVLTANAQFIQDDLNKIKVTVEITTNNTELKNQLYSYVNRELREIKDIEIVENDTFYQVKLEFVLLPTKTVGGETLGFSMSLVITRTYLCRTSDKAYKEGFLVYEEILKHQLFMGAIEDLKRISAGIITDLDGEILKRERRRRDIVNERFKNLTLPKRKP